MINLRTEPSLGTMVLTRMGAWKYTYFLPRGMEFPPGTEAYVLVTNRAGSELATIEGVVDADKVIFTAPAGDTDHVPNGSNFEMFIVLPDEGPIKVRYGRVIRREPRFPLSPLSTDEFVAAMYEDKFNRNEVGDRWVPKYGRPGMHPLVGVSASQFGMAARNAADIFGQGLSLWQSTAVLWYAPLRSDTVEIKVGLATQPGWFGNTGDGTAIIVLASNYNMKNWLGIRFYDAGLITPQNGISVVTGTGPTQFTIQGPTYAHTVPTSGQLYTIRYTYPDNTVRVWIGEEASGTPVVQWEDTTNLVTHGEGNRYVGGVWIGSAIHPGPCLWYWKAMDDL